jgi:hypothetical protein
MFKVQQKTSQKSRDNKFEKKYNTSMICSWKLLKTLLKNTGENNMAYMNTCIHDFVIMNDGL